MTGKVLVGVSGWRYTPWRGHFYPKGLARSRELEHASRVFPSLELNGSFYSLQRPGSYSMWARETPPGFVFAIKDAGAVGARCLLLFRQHRQTPCPRQRAGTDGVAGAFVG